MFESKKYLLKVAEVRLENFNNFSFSISSEFIYVFVIAKSIGQFKKIIVYSSVKNTKIPKTCP